MGKGVRKGERQRHTEGKGRQTKIERNTDRDRTTETDTQVRKGLVGKKGFKVREKDETG